MLAAMSAKSSHTSRSRRGRWSSNEARSASSGEILRSGSNGIKANNRAVSRPTAQPATMRPGELSSDAQHRAKDRARNSERQHLNHVNPNRLIRCRANAAEQRNGTRFDRGENVYHTGDSDPGKQHSDEHSEGKIARKIFHG